MLAASFFAPLLLLLGSASAQMTPVNSAEGPRPSQRFSQIGVKIRWRGQDDGWLKYYNPAGTAFDVWAYDNWGRSRLFTTDRQYCLTYSGDRGTNGNGLFVGYCDDAPEFVFDQGSSEAVRTGDDMCIDVSNGEYDKFQLWKCLGNGNQDMEITGGYYDIWV